MYAPYAAGVHAANNAAGASAGLPGPAGQLYRPMEYNDGLLTVQEAAEMLRMTPSALYTAVRLGKLRRHVVFGRVLVEEAEVVRYRPKAGGELPSGRGAGRPRTAPRGSGRKPARPASEVHAQEHTEGSGQ